MGHHPVRVFRRTRPARTVYGCAVDGCLSVAAYRVYNSLLDELEVCARCAEELMAAGWHVERKI